MEEEAMQGRNLSQEVDEVKGKMDDISTT